MEAIDFVKKIYPIALEIKEINAKFITAQAALESGWGKYAIGNNLFGITKGSWQGKTQLVKTTEYFATPDKKFTLPEKVVSVEKVGDRYKYTVYRLFRDYDSIKDCLIDHLAILKKDGYKDAWEYRHDPYKFAEKIVDSVGAKYATAPDYAKTMHDMIRSVEKRLKQLGYQ